MHRRDSTVCTLARRLYRLLLAPGIVVGLAACGGSDGKSSSSGSGGTASTRTVTDCSQISSAAQTGLGAADECYEGDDYACAIEQKIFAATNELRKAEKGTHAYDRELTVAARAWSAGQAKAGKISHDGFPDTRYETLEAEFSAPAVRIVAENVGVVGANFKLTAEDAAGRLANGWWESPGHKANIMSDFALIGVGVHYDAAAGRVYGTQIFGCR